MKKFGKLAVLAAMVLALACFVSCDNPNDNSPKVVSSWKWTEDMGDLMKGESILTFYDNGTFTRTLKGTIFGIDVDISGSGTYTGNANANGTIEITFTSLSGIPDGLKEFMPELNKPETVVINGETLTYDGDDYTKTAGGTTATGGNDDSSSSGGNSSGNTDNNGGNEGSGNGDSSGDTTGGNEDSGSSSGSESSATLVAKFTCKNEDYYGDGTEKTYSFYSDNTVKIYKKKPANNEETDNATYILSGNWNNGSVAITEALGTITNTDNYTITDGVLMDKYNTKFTKVEI